ncbi:MAG: thioredoxin domain-containing protein [Myxococcales bacterium]|nr:thioredoxin domain-containing protein [Myxococcales bacterium]
MDKLLWDKVFSSKNFDKDKMTDGQGAQRCWETAEGCPIVVGLAQELQLNIEKFKADMKGECQPAIQRDQAALRALGMSGTPGFFINGRWISGAQQIGTFVAVIDDELKKRQRAHRRRLAAGELLPDLGRREGAKDPRRQDRRAAVAVATAWRACGPRHDALAPGDAPAPGPRRAGAWPATRWRLAVPGRLQERGVSPPTAASPRSRDHRGTMGSLGASWVRGFLPPRDSPLADLSLVSVLCFCPCW